MPWAAFLSDQWPGTLQFNLLYLVVSKPKLCPGLRDDGMGGLGGLPGALSLALPCRALLLFPPSRESQECHPPLLPPSSLYSLPILGGRGGESGWQEQVSRIEEEARAPEGRQEEHGHGSGGRVTDQSAQAPHKPGLTWAKSQLLAEGARVGRCPWLPGRD